MAFALLLPLSGNQLLMGCPAKSTNKKTRYNTGDSLAAGRLGGQSNQIVDFKKKISNIE